MSTIAIQSHRNWKPFRFVASFLPKMTGPSVDIEVDDQESRVRRDFTLEMMNAHPEAFQHEFDCQNMMSFYPSRF